MQAMIQHLDTSREYFFKEGCHILEIWNDAKDSGLSIARARVAPGVKTRTHWLKGTIERYFILSGEGEVQVGSLPPTKVGAGSIVIIPEATEQSIRNSGDEDLLFLAICSPRFDPANYFDRES